MIFRMPEAQLKSREPLYLRVCDEIGAQIASGSLPNGWKLPPERVISEQMGVSRATVRRALAALEADGLIEAVQGRGTFLTMPRLVEPPNTLMSFTQLARERGTPPHAVVLDLRVRPATIDEADRFRIAPGSEIFDLQRLRKMDSLPVAIDRSAVPLAVAPDLPHCDWTSASLYEQLAESNNQPARADYDVEARSATAEQAKHLDVAVGAPVLVAETVCYTREGRLIEAGQMVYRGDRYRLRATLISQWPTLQTASPSTGRPPEIRSIAPAAG